jgi:hypothetical protein
LTSTDKVYKQAINRVFAEKHHDDRMAVYWGRGDDTINVIASRRHYVHKIADEKEDTLSTIGGVTDFEDSTPLIRLCVPVRRLSRPGSSQGFANH